MCLNMTRFSCILCFLFSIFLISDGQIFMSNNAGTSSSSSITQICNNGRCQTCINDKCFNRSFGSMRTQGQCPPAVCDSYSCNRFVIWHNKCPVCVCSNGTAYQNPCQNNGDCDSRATCQENICTFTNVPANLQAACSFDYECRETDSCQNGSCEKGASLKHIANFSCVFDRDCPSGFQCSAMTCYEASSDTPDHVQGVNCVFRYQCPNGYYCDRMTCFKDPNNRKHIPGLPCTIGCPHYYSCQQMTCVEA